MPMSFPTHQSVVNRATQRGFRAPVEGETEDQYRSNFANFMRLVDPVEASEISSGRGWDQQSPLSVLLGSGLFDKDKPELYAAQIKVLDVDSVPHEIAHGIRIETVEGAARLICDYHHGRAEERKYGDYCYDDDCRGIARLKTRTVNIVVDPRNCKYPSGLHTQDRQTSLIGGNIISLFDADCYEIDENVSADSQVIMLDAVTKRLAVIAQALSRKQFICIGHLSYSFPAALA